MAHLMQMIGIKGAIFIRFIQGMLISWININFITIIKFMCELHWNRSYKDSDGDGIGDLNGITSKLEHLKEIGMDGVWLSPIFKVMR